MRTTQRDVLVSTAERLFAEQGIDAVSLRTVMAEAGTNVAAVRYHFGTKDALVEAVVRARSEEIREARDVFLSALETAPDPDVRGIAEAFVLPLARMASTGDTSWIRLVAGIASNGNAAIAVIDGEFADQTRRLGVLLRRALPDLDPVSMRFRMTTAMTLAYRTLGDVVDLRSRIAAPGTPPVDDQRVVDELVDAVTSVLAGPACPLGRHDLTGMPFTAALPESASTKCPATGRWCSRRRARGRPTSRVPGPVVAPAVGQRHHARHDLVGDLDRHLEAAAAST